MKKILCVIFMFLLVGCTSTAKVKPITRGLSFTAEMTYYNEYYEMAIDIAKDGNTKIMLTQPEELADLVFEFKDGKVTTTFKGINCEMDDSYKTAAVGFIISAFKNQEQTVYKNKNQFYTNGKCDGGEYTLYIAETGLPLKICDSNNRFEIIIKNATLHKEK